MNLYKVTLNLNKEIHVFHTYAICPFRAKNQAMIRLALKMKMTKLSLFKNFEGNKDNFAIKEVR